MIEGGWEYVRAAYAVVWIGFLLYGASLYVRLRKSFRAREDGNENENENDSDDDGDDSCRRLNTP